MATHSHGTVLKFTPSGGTQVAVGKLTGIGELTPDSEVVDVTTLDSAGGYRESMQGFREAGELTLTGFYASGDAGQSAIRAAYGTGAIGAVEIDFTDGSTCSFNAYVKSHTVGSAEVDGAVGFGAVLRLTGPVTFGEAE